MCANGYLSSPYRGIEEGAKEFKLEVKELGMKMDRGFEKMDRGFDGLWNKIDGGLDRADTKSDRLVYSSLVGLCWKEGSIFKSIIN